MDTSQLLQNKINLIELCDKDSKLANDLVSNAYSYPFITKKTIEGIPLSLLIQKPLSCTDLNRIIKITGSVIKTYPIYFKNVTSEQLCLICNDLTYLSDEENRKLKGSNFCLSCGSKCVKSEQNFQSSFAIQSIRIQDLSNSNSMSETIEIVIEGDNAGICIPGDKVSVTGIAFRKWKNLRFNEPMISTICIKALHIVKEDEEDDQFHEIKHLVEDFNCKTVCQKRKWLLDAFCSELYGMSHVKLGMLMALVGSNSLSKDHSIRTNSHVLLVGDTGTGKSHLLKAIARLINPSILTNGVGTTDAGLTSCAIKQGKEWALEAGALVLADMGICCIDEFHKLRVNEKSGLLEAMEQQTISIAKAGMVTSLSTRCSVFASAGTRYDYNFKKPVSENLCMSTPLISRFDLIFGMFDNSQKAIDEKLADKILERNFQPKFSEELKWSTKTLKAYIAQKRKLNNKLTEKLSDIISRYYTRKKALDGNNEFNTVRMLESLVRLSECHSKLMNKDNIGIEDVFTAIMLMEGSISSGEKVVLNYEEVLFNEEAFERGKLKVIEKYKLEGFN